MAKCVAEQLADQVFAKLALVRTVATAFGRREIEKNAAANRVVAVPLGAPVIKEADRVGVPKKNGAPAWDDVGRILYVREFEIEWHCHGVRNGGDAADFAQAEGIYLDTLRSIRLIAHAAVLFSRESWVDQQVGQDSMERLGSVVSFVSTLGLPIYEAAPTRVTLTADPQIQTTVQLPDDGSGETVTINENGE